MSLGFKCATHQNIESVNMQNTSVTCCYPPFHIIDHGQY